MSIEIGWPEIALRLILTLLAGAIVGINREEHGRSAGLRTTMLVCLAASLSMIQVNLLLGMTGKTPASFAVMDLMRLPLGILSGMGFIGAGAILRKDTLITGVTTAATLWFATVMGLCFGGGQVGLGSAALVLAFLILTGLKPLEAHWHKAQEGTLTLMLEAGASRPEIEKIISGAEGKVLQWLEIHLDPRGLAENLACRVTWPNSHPPAPPPFLQPLARLPGIARVEWKLTGPGS